MLEISSASRSPNNIAIAYVRVSTKEQAEKGSIDYQKDLAKKYVEKYNKDICDSTDGSKERSTKMIFLEWIFEEPRPASTVTSNKTNKNSLDNIKNRPELQRILDYAQKKQFGHLIVQSRDRLSRNFEEFVSLKYIFKKNNVKIHYCRPGENLDLEDAKINRFIDNILASVAELEANVLSVRVKSGSKQCIENGNWAGGRPPLGYLIEKVSVPGKKKLKARLKTSIYEKNQVIKVFKLYNQGYSYREIADIINSESGTKLWTKSKVEGILKNETYTGYITWDRRGGRRHSGKHLGPSVQSKFNENLCFITRDSWQALRNLSSYKKDTHDPKYFNTPYLLKNKLICGECTEKLRTKNYGRNKNGENVCVYKCITIKDKKSELILNKSSIEHLVLDKIKDELNNINIDNFWFAYTQERDKNKESSEKLIHEISEKMEYVYKMRNNIQSMIKDLQGNLIDDNSTEDENSLENEITKENKKKNEQIMALIDMLTYQDTLFVKINQKYASEKKTEEKTLYNKYFDDKSKYSNLLNRFVINIDKLDDRNKRLLVDLIVDRIYVYKNDNDISIRIIFNPSEIIRTSMA